MFPTPLHCARLGIGYIASDETELYAWIRRLCVNSCCKLFVFY